MATITPLLPIHTRTPGGAFLITDEQATGFEAIS